MHAHTPHVVHIRQICQMPNNSIHAFGTAGSADMATTDNTVKIPLISSSSFLHQYRESEVILRQQQCSGY